MKSTGINLICILFIAATSFAAEYELGKESLPQEGVPIGTVTEYTWDISTVFPGTTRSYWVYVPAQYDAAKPACLMVLQDGRHYVKPDGQVRAPTVFDNLIHSGEMPVTIGLFVDPGKKEGVGAQRSIEFDTLSDSYARLLLEELIPEIVKQYNITGDREGRAIGGVSSGGSCAFTAAWERPDQFSKVVSHIGSFVDLREAHDYPALIRQTEGNPKPIRVFLQDGENDLNNRYGNWPLANRQMKAALDFAGYESKFVMGTGGHNLEHGGAIFPDTLRWLWRDYPGVKQPDGSGAAN